MTGLFQVFRAIASYFEYLKQKAAYEIYRQERDHRDSIEERRIHLAADHKVDPGLRVALDDLLDGKLRESQETLRSLRGRLEASE